MKREDYMGKILIQTFQLIMAEEGGEGGEFETALSSTEKKKYSIGGFIISGITGAIGIFGLVSVAAKSLPVKMIPGYIFWLVPALVMAIRSCRLPMGWKKGLATFLGGVFAGLSTIPISIPLISRHPVSIANGIGSIIFLLVGIFFLRRGFKPPQ
jgi:hypothetical protein